MRSAPALTLAVTLLIAAGQAKGAPARPPAGVSPGWATPTELRWMARLGDDGRALGAGATRVAFCTRLAASVGVPPTKRLLPSFRAFEAGCAAAAGAGGRGTSWVALLERGLSEAVVGWNRRLPTENGLAAESHADPVLARAARGVAGKRVEVRCWDPTDWDSLTSELVALGLLVRGSPDRVAGLALPGGDAVDLRSEVCYYLGLAEIGTYSSDPGAGAAAIGRALDVLAHEAEHAHGVRNEARTECYALQHVAEVGRALGIPAGVARRIADAVWRTYPAEPTVYRTPGCRNGGPLDLHAGASAWP